jgi:site-specific DNA-methyltransferase (adenine-specific)/adenine-specific DNA-methyltransferase
MLFDNYRLQDEYTDGANLVLAQGDAFAFTKGLPDSSVQLVITSPPYNIGKSYETKASIDGYRWPSAACWR